jgi:hypothetical protein
VWTDCSQYGARCGESPRHPGYLACIKETGSLAPNAGSQYATLYPIRGGKPITVAVNTGTVSGYRALRRRTVTGYSIIGSKTSSRKSNTMSWSTWKVSTNRTFRTHRTRTIPHRTITHSRTPTPRTITYRPRTNYRITHSRRIFTRKWMRSKWTYRRTYPWVRNTWGSYSGNYVRGISRG